MNVNVAKSRQRSQYFDACNLSTIKDSQRFQLRHIREPFNISKFWTCFDPEKTERGMVREAAEILQLCLAK